MDALDVISLAEAKAYLAVDFGDNDEQIKGLIHSAVALVEKYTGYALYNRDVTYNSFTCTKAISTYPIELTGVTYDGAATAYKTRQGTLTLYVDSRAGATISANIGYTEKTDIPAPLIAAALKTIVSLYEYREVYATSLPVDVQLMLNPYRRNATI